MIMTETRITLAAAWILTGLAASFTQHMAFADDSGPCAASAETKRIPAVSDVLTKVPYFTQRATVVGTALIDDAGNFFVVVPRPVNPSAKSNGTESVERFGIDFNFSPFDGLWSQGEFAGTCGHCVADACSAASPLDRFIVFSQPVATSCPTTGCAVSQLAQNACVAQGVCAASNHEQLAGTCVAATQVAANSESCGSDTCTHDTAKCRPRIERLIAENAALAVALQAKDEFLELRSEMMEELMSVTAQKIQLEHRLAITEKLLTEREKIYNETRELLAENARLKAQSEAVEAQHTAEKLQLQLAIENERLKLRVAELEQQSQDGASNGVRTAKKAGSRNKAQ